MGQRRGGEGEKEGIWDAGGGIECDLLMLFLFVFHRNALWPLHRFGPFTLAPSLAFTRPCLSLSCLLCLGLTRMRGTMEPAC